MAPAPTTPAKPVPSKKRVDGDGPTPAATPTAAAAPVAPAAAPRPAEPAEAPAPAPAPTPAAQVVAKLAPLRHGPDGVHRLTIHLNPADLGPISVTAEVRRGDIAVRLAGATDAGREALRASLPELQRDLQDAGFGSCPLDLQRDAPDQGRHTPGERPAPSTRDGAPSTADSRPSTPDSAPTVRRGALDLHV